VGVTDGGCVIVESVIDESAGDFLGAGGDWSAGWSSVADGTFLAIGFFGDSCPLTLETRLKRAATNKKLDRVM
jgi:hypothetical protein